MCPLFLVFFSFIANYFYFDVILHLLWIVLGYLPFSYCCYVIVGFNTSGVFVFLFFFWYPPFGLMPIGLVFITTFQQCVILLFFSYFHFFWSPLVLLSSSSQSSVYMIVASSNGESSITVVSFIFALCFLFLLNNNFLLLLLL